ncbi:hypothetical protein CFP71_28270 [Amycolatopsis thailandensis]|uniref:2'-5' RNA ligase n=1 Tax=Amycolatopsis thailandensis TaxID=589330 RepID=A0A229RUH4_9PSEU|nr:hypothetical protein [Amycolatopsis thailandensis]OXM50328.1 hypothetical protein CFP71_28270 [Amycolatopsis thailandensis]
MLRDAFRPGQRWPEHYRQLTIIATPRLDRPELRQHGDALAELVDTVRWTAQPFLSHSVPVPDKWLHQPIHVINPRDSDCPPPDDTTLAELVSALTFQLGRWSAFPVRSGSPLVGVDTITLDNDFDEPLGYLTRDIRQVVSNVCGPASVQDPPRPGHLTLFHAYGNEPRFTHADHARFLTDLAAIRPSHATWPLDTLLLAWVRHNHRESVYDWELVHSFTLPTLLPGHGHGHGHGPRLASSTTATH